MTEHREDVQWMVSRVVGWWVGRIEVPGEPLPPLHCTTSDLVSPPALVTWYLKTQTLQKFINY